MLNQEFQGERLKEARLYRGKTINEVADVIQVTKQMISKYENNKAVPSFESLSNIADYLRFPYKFFYQKPIELKSGSTFFRSLMSAGKKEREMQKDRGKYITLIRASLEEYVDFPDLDLNIQDYKDIDDIEDITLMIRNKWGLGENPIDNAVNLLEKKGFVVGAIDTNSSNIDAFGTQFFVKNKLYETIILGNDKNSFYRRQFNVVHEFGHKVLHDSNLDLFKLEKEQFKKIEEEAHHFASSFLLPKNAFIKDVSLHPTNLDYYKVLKQKWHVSIGAMIVRAYKLGVINLSTYQYLQRQLSIKNWRIKEPFDDTKKIAKPIAIKQAVEVLLDNKYIKAEEFFKNLENNYNLALDYQEIEQLIGLDRDYLKPIKQSDGNNIININDILINKKNK